MASGQRAGAHDRRRECAAVLGDHEAPPHHGDLVAAGCVLSAAGNIILFRKDQMDVIADESNPFNQMRVIISMDPPDHRTFRKVASGSSRRGITRLDEIVTDTATLMMDRLAEHGDEPVDFVELVAQAASAARPLHDPRRARGRRGSPA